MNGKGTKIKIKIQKPVAILRKNSVGWRCRGRRQERIRGCDGWNIERPHAEKHVKITVYMQVQKRSEES